MALAKYGPLVESLSGKIGTVTFKAGQSTGVITRAPRPGTHQSPTQRTQRAVFLYHLSQWMALTPEDQRTWATISKTTPFPNRLGVYRTLTGRQLFLRYRGQMDPDGTETGDVSRPPLIGSPPTFRIDWIWFTVKPPSVSRLAIINLTTNPPNDCYMHLWVRRHLHLGPRDSGARRIYIGSEYQPYDWVDWQPQIEAKGIVFDEMELLELEIRWSLARATWLSPPLLVNTTASQTYWWPDAP